MRKIVLLEQGSINSAWIEYLVTHEGLSFYDWLVKNKTSDKSKFLWYPSNIQSRINWLDKQIAKLEK